MGRIQSGVTGQAHAENIVGAFVATAVFTHVDAQLGAHHGRIDAFNGSLDAALRTFTPAVRVVRLNLVAVAGIPFHFIVHEVAEVAAAFDGVKGFYSDPFGGAFALAIHAKTGFIVRSIFPVHLDAIDAEQQLVVVHAAGRNGGCSGAWIFRQVLAAIVVLHAHRHGRLQ